MGPPTSGGVTVGQILGLLSHFDLGSRPNPADIHLYLESARLAYADRARYLADSDFVPVPLRGLLDPDYLKQRAALINADRAESRARRRGRSPPDGAIRRGRTDRGPVISSSATARATRSP